MVVFLLVITAASLVLAGFLTEMTELSIGAGVIALAAGSLVAGRVLADRREQQSETSSAQTADEEDDVPARQPTGDESSAAVDRSDVADGIDSPDGEREAAGAEQGVATVRTTEPDVEIVRVIAGRKRFHKPGCSSLADRQSEELTREEAEEEGFTPCSLCAKPVANGSC